MQTYSFFSIPFCGLIFKVYSFCLQNELSSLIHHLLLKSATFLYTSYFIYTIIFHSIPFKWDNLNVTLVPLEDAHSIISTWEPRHLWTFFSLLFGPCGLQLLELSRLLISRSHKNFALVNTVPMCLAPCNMGTIYCSNSVVSKYIPWMMNRLFLHSLYRIEAVFNTPLLTVLTVNRIEYNFNFLLLYL